MIILPVNNSNVRHPLASQKGFTMKSKTIIPLVVELKPPKTLEEHARNSGYLGVKNMLVAYMQALRDMYLLRAEERTFWSKQFKVRDTRDEIELARYIYKELQILKDLP